MQAKENYLVGHLYVGKQRVSVDNYVNSKRSSIIEEIESTHDPIFDCTYFASAKSARLSALRCTYQPVGIGSLGLGGS